jgi:hypothetical protein
VERLAAAVFSQAQSLKAEGPLGVFVKGSSPALDRAFATALIAKLSKANLAGVPIDGVDFSTAEAVARKIGTRSLIRLELSLRGSELSARGDLISTWVNFWSGRIPTRAPQPAGTLEARVPVDAVALALAESKGAANMPSPPVRLAVQRIATVPTMVAALAVGDINGDAVPEIVALTENALIAFDISGRMLGQMSAPKEVASAPRSREPFGSLVILERPARIAYAWVNSARSAVIAFDAPTASFREIETLREAPVANWGGELLSATILPGHNAFGPMLSLKGQPLLELKRPVQGCSTWTDGSNDWVLVAFSDGSGAVYPHGLKSPPAYQLSGLGAGVTLVNLNGGPAPQIASTAPQYNPPQDELRISPIDKKLVPEITVALGSGKAWYAARLPGKNRRDEVIVGILRPDGTTDLLRLGGEP